MTSSTDTEITLGTGKLLFLFFFLVGVCSLFFALGYSLGRKSDGITTASAASPPPTSLPSTKPAGGDSAQPSMSFYKSVEQKDVSSELPAPAPEAKSEGAAGVQAAAQPTANPTESATPATTGGYFVQVAAVSKQDDAEALVDALKKKQYPAFIASAASNTTTADKLFRVQLGPFADIKEAEAQRTRLIGDGYNPILKK
jgi:DedD protein